MLPGSSLLCCNMPPAEQARRPIHSLQTLDGGAGDAEEQQEGQQQEGSEDEADAIGAMAARRRQVRCTLPRLRAGAPEQQKLSLRDLPAVTSAGCFCTGKHHTAVWFSLPQPAGGGEEDAEGPQPREASAGGGRSAGGAGGSQLCS